MVMSNAILLFASTKHNAEQPPSDWHRTPQRVRELKN